MVPPLLEDTVPCYLFFRLDDRNAYKNYTWIFFSFTPDRAPVSLVCGGWGLVAVQVMMLHFNSRDRDWKIGVIDTYIINMATPGY